MDNDMNYFVRLFYSVAVILFGNLLTVLAALADRIPFIWGGIAIAILGAFLMLKLAYSEDSHAQDSNPVPA